MEGGLGGSYLHAFSQRGWAVAEFSAARALQDATPVSPRLARWSDELHPSTVINRVNRAFVLEALDQQPDVVLVINQPLIRPAALAQVQAELDCKTALIYPDPLNYMSNELLEQARICDAFFYPSARAVQVLKTHGVDSAQYLPFAADSRYLLDPIEEPPGADVSFIGTWRPEREAILSLVTDLDLEVLGDPKWLRRSVSASLRQRARRGTPRGQAYAQALRECRIALNLMDPTPRPLHNMRLFEIPGAGGFQLVTRAEEVQRFFTEGLHISTYEGAADLHDSCVQLLKEPERRTDMAAAAHSVVSEAHLYENRVDTLSDTLCG